MKRLTKILTLGLEKKRAWQLPIIAALLVLFGLGVRWWYNSRAAKGIRLLDMVDINDIEGVRWILRWDREQVSAEGEISRMIRGNGKLYSRKYYPLFLALEKDYTSIVKALIEAGADVNAKTGGSTPLHWAARHGHIEVVKILFAAGADVNARQWRGETPLYQAIQGTNIEMTKLLLKAGADVNTKVTASLWWVAGGVREEEIELKTSGGYTVLHLPANSAEGLILVGLLIEAGGSLNIRENEGRTPLDWAMHFQNRGWAKLLRKHGAKTAAELDAEAKQPKGKEE